MIVPDTGHASHRAKVGMIGLAAVLLLIGLAAAVFATATKERPFQFAASTRSQTAQRPPANPAAPSDTATNEPLAELGVAPSSAAADNASDVARGH